MKHFKTYLLCLGLALTTASCSQDDFDSTEATSEKLVEMSFIAGSSQPVTRTVLGSDGATVTWQANDKIGIGFKGYQPKNYLRHHQQVVTSSFGDKQLINQTPTS